MADTRQPRRRGRPRIGKGARRVLITVERDLLKATDAAAKRAKVSRSQFIAQALRGVLPPTTQEK